MCMKLVLKRMVQRRRREGCFYRKSIVAKTANSEPRLSERRDAPPVRTAAVVVSVAVAEAAAAFSPAVVVVIAVAAARGVEEMTVPLGVT